MLERERAMHSLDRNARGGGDRAGGGRYVAGGVAASQMTLGAENDTAVTRLTHEDGELVFACDVPPAASIFDCLRLAWQEAHSEACGTYEHWRVNPGPDAYPVYRAAQDRADAAQDALAHCSDRSGLTGACQPGLAGPV
jgi:hypothetical protein